MDETIGDVFNSAALKAIQSIEPADHGIAVHSRSAIGFQNYNVDTIGSMIKSIKILDEDEDKLRFIELVGENDAYPTPLIWRICVCSV